MLEFQEIHRPTQKKKRYRIHVKYSLDAPFLVQRYFPEIEEEYGPWIDVERKSGKFYVVGENITERGDWRFARTKLSFSEWTEEYENLDYSDAFVSGKLRWNECVLTPQSFEAPSIERLAEALEHVCFTAWSLGDE